MTSIDGFIKPLGELPKVVPGFAISKDFLASINAPADATELTFSIEASGVLKCRAVYYMPDRSLDTKEWEVYLKTTDPLYRVLTGKL